MRCAHCGRDVTHRNWHQFRADGGYRCVHCDNVFYVDAGQARKRLWWISLLWMIGILLGGIALGRFVEPNPWVIVAYIAVLMVVGVAILSAIARHRLADVSTLPGLPRKVLWRRRCFAYGAPFFIVGQLLAIVSRPYVPTDDWSHYISITGSAIFFLFILAGFAMAPSTDTEPPAR